MGLVMMCSLGEFLGVPTPVSRTFVQMGQWITGIDYFKEGKRTLQSLGLGGMNPDQLAKYLETGVMG